MKLLSSIYKPLIRAALHEDLGSIGDLTTHYFIPPHARLSGRIVARSAGVVCGVDIAAAVFRALDPRCRVKIFTRDGDSVSVNQTVLTIAGNRALLTAERTALNFLQQLSGVATLTASYVRHVHGTRAAIYDTRKTTPGWRALQKYAVRCGGGRNHRMGLYDAAMVKDNHWTLGADLARGTRALRRQHPRAKLIIEADTREQALRALELHPDILLLDNMSPSRLGRLIQHIRVRAPRVAIEISGGITLKNVRALARSGADRLSIGRLTHSAPALDMSLDLA